MKQFTTHAVAFCTVFVWGITFISTKILLADLTAQEILFSRFFLGWLALCAFKPELPVLHGARQEINFAAAGFFGVTLYFLLENIALEYTYTANVGVIVSTAPFFTALAEWLCFGGQKPAIFFYIGFIAAITGIACISFQDQQISFNPVGDTLALLAAVAWAFYSCITKKLSQLKLGTIATTRRIFFYGIALMIPVILASGWHASLQTLLAPKNLGNIVFLGLGASALCFVTWTYCLERLGVDKASAYIYLVPAITVLAAAVILQEKISLLTGAGMLLVISGLIISECGSGKIFFLTRLFSRKQIPDQDNPLRMQKNYK